MDVPVIVEHQQHVVQPVHVVEEPVVQYNRRVIPGPPQVLGETIARIEGPAAYTHHAPAPVPVTVAGPPPVQTYAAPGPRYGPPPPAPAPVYGGAASTLPPGYKVVSEEYRQVR